MTYTRLNPRDCLPLSGGTLTGTLKIKSAGTRGTTPSANQYRDYEFVDSDNKRLSIVESVIQTSANGDANMLRLLVLGHYTSADDYGGITIKKTNGNTGNANMYFDANTGELTGFKMSADRITDGTLPVGRGGTGQTGVIKSTLTQAQAFDSVTSGVTVSNVYVAKWGEVMTLQITFKYNAAQAANASLTIGTLKSAYRPAYIVGGGSHNFAGYISNNGAVTVRNVTGSSLSANTDRWFGFTFVLA